jgi:16S rRNA (guanine527-N7)-methyltransferase
MSNFDDELENAFLEFLPLNSGVMPILNDVSRKQLLTYIRMVAKWNKVFNLTSVRTPHEMVTQHLLDCVFAVFAMQAFQNDQTPWKTVVDVGSGAGLPGVIMAILWPDSQIHCVDAVAKKTSFIAQVRAEMQLHNLHAHHARIETFQLMKDGIPYFPDLVTCRAYSSIQQFLTTAAISVGPATTLIAMKGKSDLNRKELLEAGPTMDSLGLTVVATPTLTVPGLAAERQLIILQTKRPLKPLAEVTIANLQMASSTSENN